jgi:hypothetical protein
MSFAPDSLNLMSTLGHATIYGQTCPAEKFQNLVKSNHAKRRTVGEYDYGAKLIG